MTECAICFSDFEDKKGKEVLTKVQCSNPGCEGAICDSCLGDMITFVASQKQLPLCTTPGCTSHYSTRTLRKALDKPGLNMYGNCLLVYFLAQHENDITFSIQKTLILQRLHESRLKYLEEKFPLGLQLVAKIALSHKLKSTTEQRKKLEKSVKKGKRSCLRTGCKGKLNEALECALCSSKFCKYCELKIKPNHICKDEDVETVKMLAAEVKCPTCFMPINKTVGCNHMVCSNCHTRFDYGTGEKSAHGDLANAAENSNLRNIGILEVYKDYIKSHPRSDRIRKLIEEIVSFGPKPASDQPIRKLLRTHLKVLANKESDEDDIEDSVRLTSNKLVTLFEDFSNDTLDYSDYITDIDYIEQSLRSKKVSIRTLKDIHRDWSI